ncbi:MAG: hypothetical protein FJX23_04295 [Alphaproteobacteria bacterium]|nr:hypothetical protein [Alphaproteobacteria bacterium]
MPISSIGASTYGISATKTQESLSATGGAQKPTPVERVSPIATTLESNGSPETLNPADSVVNRARALVGSEKVDDVLTESGSIDYLALARIIAEQQEKMQLSGEAAKPSTQPVNLVDILA